MIRAANTAANIPTVVVAVVVAVDDYILYDMYGPDDEPYV